MLLRRSILSMPARKVVGQVFNKAVITQRFQSDISSGPSRVTLEIAKQMPKNYDQMPNDILITMAGNPKLLLIIN